jgi:hypothetical protein
MFNEHWFHSRLKGWEAVGSKGWEKLGTFEYSSLTTIDTELLLIFLSVIMPLGFCRKVFLFLEDEFCRICWCFPVCNLFFFA